MASSSSGRAQPPPTALRRSRAREVGPRSRRLGSAFSEEAAANRSRPVGRRLYWGPSLRSLNAGGAHVCGLSDAHDPACWEWPDLKLPKGLDFSGIALGKDFLCGILAKDNTSMSCYGGMKAPSLTPQPAAFRTVAAGHRHACAVDDEGGFACWGDGVPKVPPAELPESMSAMALGNDTTCILDGKGIARCWGGAPVPAQYKSTPFLAIEADGDAVCAITMYNYSVVCWGKTDRFGGGRLIYNATMPGACAPQHTCPCGIIWGSGALCGNGGGEGVQELAVCHPCQLPLNASRIVIANGMTKAAPPPGDDDDAKKKKTLAVALSVAGVGAAVLAAAGTAFYLVAFRKREKKTLRLGESSSRRLCRDVEAMVMPAPQVSPVRPARPLGCEEFTLRELSRLTNGFAEEKKIGSGSFGSVYRAKLPDGREVAIKRAERGASGGRRRRFDAERAFRAELRLLSRVNHRNLVQLLGFCEERGERILVFEFMPHGALHDHLHGGEAGGGRSPLFASWEARLRVALDAARGVEYLHCYAVPPIIHRDIKSSNILLDGGWTARVSDFGLSLMGPPEAEEQPGSQRHLTVKAAGTVGYMDPEYYGLHHLTVKSDVYGFGVVMLEALTGRRAIFKEAEGGSPVSVVDHAVPSILAGELRRVLDPRAPEPAAHEAEAVELVAYTAVHCVRLEGKDRPAMADIVANLETALALCEGSDRGGAGFGNSSSSASLSVTSMDRSGALV